MSLFPLIEAEFNLWLYTSYDDKFMFMMHAVSTIPAARYTVAVTIENTLNKQIKKKNAYGSFAGLGNQT